MAGEYGPIFKAQRARRHPAASCPEPDLVDEICDDARFDKRSAAGWRTCSEGPAGAGLFTAETNDPLWQRAHNILMAPVQPAGDARLHAQDARHRRPADGQVGAAQPGRGGRRRRPDMTRLTLDTIALCGFGYRFNSFYRDTPHPFVEAMVRTLAEAQARARQLPIQTRLRIRAQRQLEEDQAFMNDLVDRIIAERRAQGDAADTTDLLGRMLTGVDKERARACPTRTSAPSASRSSSRATRRPRACCRSRSTTCSRTRTSWPGRARRGRRGARRHAPRRRSSRCTG